MLLQTILEGLWLGALLVAVCAVGIRKGAVGMVHLYDQKVQERCIALGLTTEENIKRNALCFKAICIPMYLRMCCSACTPSMVRRHFGTVSGSAL